MVNCHERARRRQHGLQIVILERYTGSLTFLDPSSIWILRAVDSRQNYSAFKLWNGYIEVLRYALYEVIFLYLGKSAAH
jgi:hypothetical protein